MLLRLAAGTALCAPGLALAADRECAMSPEKVIELCVSVDQGRASYTVSRNGAAVIAASALGMEFAGEGPLRYTALSDAKRASRDTNWEQPWGEQRVVRDRHTELAVTLNGDTALNQAVGVTFRIFDDGIGFRYGYAGIPAGREVSIVKERTEFRPVGDYQAWWYPALGTDRDEYLYTQTDARRITLAESPLTLRAGNGTHLSFHEAGLIDFPSMLLAGDGAGKLSAWLMPAPDGVLARKTGAFTTPWRTILIGDSAGALADSRLELNLNAPNKLGDVSWIKPGKYIGIWWEMHLNRSTWGSGPTHGANTANVK
ncbi:MAG: glycoside hydrolase family 97 protein, partial [Sphingomonadales bacterium]